MECAELWYGRQCRLAEGFPAAGEPELVAPRLHLVDLQYSDVRLDKGLYNRLVARGSMKRLVTNRSAQRRRQPADGHSRVLPRGMFAQVGADIAAASWDRCIFDWVAIRWFASHVERCAAARHTSGRCWTRKQCRRAGRTTDPVSTVRRARRVDR